MSESTKCFVCGDNSSVADKCVDEYPTTNRVEDIKDCEGQAVAGCMKSKYVDHKDRQIGKLGYLDAINCVVSYFRDFFKWNKYVLVLLLSFKYY